MYYIIAYDSPSNKRRRKLCGLLKDHLAHVQESVFEGPLPAAKFSGLVSGIRKLMDPAADSVRIYRMPRTTWDATEVIGMPPLTMDRPVIVVTEGGGRPALYGDEPF